MSLKFEVAQASSETREGADDVLQSDHYLTGKTGKMLSKPGCLQAHLVKGKHKSPALSHQLLQTFIQLACSTGILHLLCLNTLWMPLN